MKAVALLALLGGCLPVGRPRVDLEPGVSLAAYHAFAVPPVADESGWPFPFDVRDSLRNELIQDLRRQGYAVSGPDSAGQGQVLRIESRLTAFATGGMVYTLEGGPGGTRCGLVSTLKDAATGRRLGAITAAIQDQGSPFEVLMACARATADELARRVRGQR